MFLDSPTNRPTRETIRQAFAELVDEFERAVPGNVIISALQDAAARLALKLDGIDLDAGPRRRGLR